MHSSFLKTSHREAYLAAVFHSKDFQTTFKIGDRVNKLAEWAAGHQKQGNYLCWLTADNPLSLQLEQHQNKTRYEQLRIAVSNSPKLEVDATDPKGLWPTERGFLILLKSPSEARNLAWKFQQKAILFFKPKRPVCMIYTLHHLGDSKVLLDDFETLIPEQMSSTDNLKGKRYKGKKLLYLTYKWNESIANQLKEKSVLYINPAGAFPAIPSKKRIQRLSQLKMHMNNLKLDR